MKTCKMFAVSLVALAMALTWWAGHATGRARLVEVGGQQVMPWSEPVNGLRTRLIAGREELRVDEDLLLILELQNISDKPITIPMPTVWDRVFPSHQKISGESDRFNVRISADLIGSVVHILPAQHEHLRELHRPVVIQPNDVFVMLVRAQPYRRATKEPKDKLRQADEHTSPHPPQVKATRWFTDEGKYRLTASLRFPAPRSGDRLKGGYEGELNTPAVAVRVAGVDEPSADE